MKERSWAKLVLPIITGAGMLVLVVVICFVCTLGLAGVSIYWGIRQVANEISLNSPAVPSLRPTRTRPAPQTGLPLTVTAPPASLSTPPSQTPLHTAQGNSASSLILPAWLTESLTTFENTEIPINDPLDLAERLEGKENLPRKLDFLVRDYQVGDEESFWVTDSDTNTVFQVKAVLRYRTEHAYFWVEAGEKSNEKDVKALLDTFETKIYPTNRAFFGSEWTPGVDADPRLFILYARVFGGSVAGYFSSADEYLPQVRKYANGHEMIFLSLDHVNLDDLFAYSVLAHEFQHTIQWYQDRNEETWLNEGSSGLAAFLNGYDIGGHDQVFARHPDIQLTYWPTDATNRTEHYGSSFLFMAYFLDRFGEAATQALIVDSANGMSSIDRVLAKLNLHDPVTDKPISADDFFTDWLLANYLQDSNIEDGRYTYHNYPAAPDFSPTASVSDCPLETSDGKVHQYGVNYIQIRCQGDYTLHFTGATEVSVLPADPYSGNYAYYSNRGDESDMTLTRAFDFTNYSAPLSLTYWTWYDLEKDYDYLNVEASLDGKKWQILTTPPAQQTTHLGAVTVGAIMDSAGVAPNGYRRKWIFLNLPEKKCSFVLNTSPMQPSMAKGFCWMMWRYQKRVILRISRMTREAGSRKVLYASATYYLSISAWR